MPSVVVARAEGGGGFAPVVAFALADPSHAGHDVAAWGLDLDGWPELAVLQGFQELNVFKGAPALAFPFG